jgi:hypothetical protein
VPDLDGVPDRAVGVDGEPGASGEALVVPGGYRESKPPAGESSSRSTGGDGEGFGGESDLPFEGAGAVEGLGDSGVPVDPDLFEPFRRCVGDRTASRPPAIRELTRLSGVWVVSERR